MPTPSPAHRPTVSPVRLALAVLLLLLSTVIGVAGPASASNAPTADTLPLPAPVAPDPGPTTTVAPAPLPPAVPSTPAAPAPDPAQAVGLSQLWTASGRVYTVEHGLAAGHLAYGDRHSAYLSVPSTVQGLTYIRPRNNDREAVGVADFFSFSVDRPARVYLAYHGTPPAWVAQRGFSGTGETVVIQRDSDRARLTLALYAKDVRPGPVTLGSNLDAPGYATMYTVMVRPTGPVMPNFDAVTNGVRPRGYGRGTYSVVPPAPGGRVWWVATNGNDANPGTTAAPLRTINQAAQVAQAGDVVTIRNGRYDESVSVRNAGTPDRPIVFQAENRGGVVLGGSNDKVFQPRGYVGELGRTGPGYVTLRGLVFRNYNDQLVVGRTAVRAGTGWRIEDVLFDRSAQTGLNVVAHDVEVVRSTFQYHTVHAMTIGRGDTGATSTSDPRYLPVRNVRLTDVVLRGNHTGQAPEGARATRIAKAMMTQGLVIDNMESYENKGQGFWFDTKNTDFVVRNSYFHDNVGFVAGDGTYRGDAARGLYIEKNWGGGLIENNVIRGNEGPAVLVVSTPELLIRGNLMVRNDRCVLLTNMTGTPGYELFPMRDITIEGNYCKDWARSSAIHHPGGPVVTPAQIRVRVNGNTYQPVRHPNLAFWSAPLNSTATTIEQMQARFGWETDGRIAEIPWS